MRMSSGLMSISMLSSISGETYTLANDVWRRLAWSKRRDAHQAMHADLAGQQPVGVFAIDAEGRRLDARFVARLIFVHAAWRSPARSAQRRYMRISISAQSCDSVPPAPG